MCCIVLIYPLCLQGDIGIQGPRGGVGAPGETVRKQLPICLTVLENFYLKLFYTILQMKNV